MKKLRFSAIVLLTSLLVTSCATVKLPNKRPFQEQFSSDLEPLDIYLVDQGGIGVGYLNQDSSAATAQYGLIGGLVGAAIDSAMTKGPREVATDSAEDIYKHYNNDQLMKDFQNKLEENYSKLSQLKFSKNVKIVLPPEVELLEGDYLLINPTYQMTAGDRSFDVNYNVYLYSEKLKYKPAYEIDPSKKPPKNHMDNENILYNAQIIYRSNDLQLPEMSKEKIKNEISLANEEYKKNSKGANSAEKKKLREAHNKRLSFLKSYPPKKTDDLSFIYLPQWLEKDALLLKQEVDKANSFFIQAFLDDLSEKNLPEFGSSADKEDKIIIQDVNGRIYFKNNKGYGAGLRTAEPKEKGYLIPWNVLKFPQATQDEIEEKRKSLEEKIKAKRESKK